MRQFAPATAAVEARWCSCASSGDVWVATGHVWGTNNRPLQLTNPAGLLGVQKPGIANPGNPWTAATEKIVADLARVFGLPVPPVTLWDRGATSGEPRYVAVSAWAFTSPLTWAQAGPLLSDQQKASLIETASAMIPFEMWIGAEDRHNDGNVLIDGDLRNGFTRGAWIDYAFALDHGWQGNLRPLGGVPAMFPPVGNRDPPVCAAIAERIASVDNGVLEAIINRIPREYLPDDRLQNPFSYLATEFDEAWKCTPRGGALNFLADRHKAALSVLAPHVLAAGWLDRLLGDEATLKSAVEREFSDLVARPATPSPIEERIQIAA